MSNRFSINKDGEYITLKIPLNAVNGDYNVIHAYDPKLHEECVKESKRLQLLRWLETTFPMCDQFPQGEEYDKKPIGAAIRIFNSSSKDDLLSLIQWLNDPVDN